MQKQNLFKNLMSPLEAGIALAYLPVHVFLLPALLVGYTRASGNELTAAFSETIYFGVGLIAITLFLWNFLRHSFDTLLDNLVYCIMTVMMGIFGILTLSQFSAIIIMLLDIDVLASLQAASPGADTVDARTLLILGLGAIPVVQETLFRGLLFGVVRKKSRIWAYLLSAAAYVFYSLWQSMTAGVDISILLILALTHIPEALMLAWCYERANSIWVPIILSASISAIAFIPFLI